MKHVDIFTDGACQGNPGPGGWAAILRFGRHEKEFACGEPNTTNNRMEMLAAIRGLQALKESCEVDLYSDSQYLVNAIVKGWIRGWQNNGWRTASKDPVKNIDLWEELLTQMERHKVRFHHVYGHSGHPENERCDKLARAAAKRIAEAPTATL